MMPRRTFYLVLVVSCAHAMVHVFELALPSVEQLIAADYGVGKEATGSLATLWRLPFGLGALGAGWLVDRLGAPRMLAVYLLGCATIALCVGLSLPFAGLFCAMFAMGLFASIYHPAGLALISHATTAENRPRALGIHGIFGSGGIGLAPFLAGLVLTAAQSWRAYYVFLSVPAAVLGIVFVAYAAMRGAAPGGVAGPGDETSEEDWSRRSYFALTVLAMLVGFIYAAVLSFLPRYMEGAGLAIGHVPTEGLRNYLAGAVLFVGCVGQYVAGRIARPDHLEGQLATVTFAAAPCLLWMGVAVGWQRLAATGLFVLVHFMHQPLYNSLVAKYSARRRRSLAYGFSFAAGMGLGSLGAVFAGLNSSDLVIHTSLAFVAVCGGLWALMLRRWSMPPGHFLPGSSIPRGGNGGHEPL